MLEEKNQSLMEFDRLKDQFLANTSHELRFHLCFCCRWVGVGVCVDVGVLKRPYRGPLNKIINLFYRTPLNGIIGIAECCLMSPQDETNTNYLNMIINCGRRLSNIVNGIILIYVNP